MLSDVDQTVLELADRPWATPGAQELAIRSELGWSRARYVQRLRQLLVDPDAVRHNPVLVYRLQRIHRRRIEKRNARQI